MTITEALGCHIHTLTILQVRLRRVPICPSLLLSRSTHRSCIISTPLLPLKALYPVTGGGWSVSYKSHRFAHFHTFQIPIVHCLFFLAFQPSRTQGQAGLFCSYYFPFVFNSHVTSSGRNFVL